MPKKDRSTLITLAQQIRDETSEAANTATRVGGLDEDIVDSMVHQDDPAQYPPVAEVYSNTAGMIGGQGIQQANYFYLALDASDAGLGITGFAYFEYKGIATASISDYRLVATENIVPPPYFDMVDQGTTDPPYREARFWYGNGSFNIYDQITGTSIQVGKEIIVDVYNNNGATLTNFTVIRYGPTVGGFPAAVRAQADTVDNANSFGICTHNIGIGQVGKVVTQGLAGGDTSMWNANDILFLSATVSGEMTNIEQAILKPVARVIVADTEVNGGKIYVFQQAIINITALGQAIGNDESQLLTTTPQPLEVYDINVFEQNVDVTQVGAGPATAIMSPASIGASGFYRVSFNISITGTSNTIHIFEVEVNGTPTGILTAVDLTNNNINSGNGAFSVITETQISNVDTIEIYAYVGAGTSTITAATVVMNIERIGNV